MKILKALILIVVMIASPLLSWAAVNPVHLETNSPYKNGINDTCGGCSGGSSCCSSSCTNVLTDNNNCGTCATVCTNGRTCQAGACACSAGVFNDNNNCGTCGVVCGSNSTCSGGACACDSGYNDCAGTCRDLQADNNNCGSCGNVCGGSDTCSAGSCTSSCAALPITSACAVGGDCCSGTCDVVDTCGDLRCCYPLGTACTDSSECCIDVAGGTRAYCTGLPGDQHCTHCFVEGTKILLSNGNSMMVENLKVGDLVLGSQGLYNKVVELMILQKQDRHIYAFNGGRYFVTEAHPFMTTDGWKAMNPVAAHEVNPQLTIGQLKEGDIMITQSGTIRLERIEFKFIKGVVVYNPVLDGSHDYYADGFLVHNKGGFTCP